MFLAFSVENFRSFRDDQVLDVRATSCSELQEVVRQPAGLETAARGVLPVVAVFGANASGKTSLFRAADFLRSAVLRSAGSTAEGTGILEAAPTFGFDAERRHGRVTLSLVFLREGVRHEYGFVLQPRRESSDRFTRVVSEWLRVWPKTHARDVFLRGDAAADAGHPQRWWVSEESFHGGRRLGKDLLEQTRDDVLFLSLASQRNQPQCKAVVSWFSDDFLIGSSSSWPISGPDTETLLHGSKHFHGYLTRLLRAADTRIDDVETTRDEEHERWFKEVVGTLSLPSGAVAQRSLYRTRTFHRDDSGSRVALDLGDESHGTQRLFALAGPIYEALRHGRCIWVDELDRGLHHWLLRILIRMFQDPEVNPKGAQLVFSSHDAALMDPTLLRRDQIWIAEKDAAQGSQLYSLVDVEDKPRKDQPLFKSFLSGRFGGVPALDEQAILTWPGDLP